MARCTHIKIVLLLRSIIGFRGIHVESISTSLRDRVEAGRYVALKATATLNSLRNDNAVFFMSLHLGLGFAGWFLGYMNDFEAGHQDEIFTPGLPRLPQPG